MARRITPFRRALLFTLTVLLFALAAQPADEAGAETNPAKVRVLFIGNSLTYFNNMPMLLERLTADEARPVAAEIVARGGAALEGHWKWGEAVATIRQRRWDFVVLQEQSLRPLREKELLFRYARLFNAEIKKAGAQTLFFHTWTRAKHPGDEKKLAEAYQEIAAELGAPVAPVGIAWANALHARPEFELYAVDGSHPGPKGSYLAACVFYAVLYGKSPVDLPALDLDRSEAWFLQEVARETVFPKTHPSPRR